MFLLLCGFLLIYGRWLYWNDALAPVLTMFCFAVLLLIGGLAYMKKNRRMAEDIGALTDRIAAVREGRLSGSLKLPEDADLKEAVENLNEISQGLEKALKERTRSERMKVELIANVSHDLKTPLTSIVSYIELLKQEAGLPEHVRDYIRILEGKAARLRDMVQDVFEVSKAASGQLPVKIEKLDFAKLLRQTLADMSVQIEQSGFADNLRSGLVLTGGCAELTNCCNYIKELSGYTVRKGYPRHLFSTGSSGCNGVFETSAAVSIGLVLTAQNDHVLDCIEGENTINTGLEVVLGGGEASVPDTGHENDGEAGAEPEPVQEPDRTPGNGTLFPDGEVPVVKPEGGKKHGRKDGGKAGDKDGDAGKGDKTVKNPPIWTKVKNLFTDYYNDLTKE